MLGNDFLLSVFVSTFSLMLTVRRTVTRRAALAYTAALSLFGCGDEVRVRLLAPLPGASTVSDARAEGGTADDAGLVEPEREGGPASEAGLVLEAGPVGTAALLHHYDFVGEGVAVSDRVGSAHGVLLGGATLDGSGTATLDGVDDYIDLPNHLLAGLSAVTFVVSLQWDGGGCWQRVFDFGSSTAGEGQAANAVTSLFLTPASCPLSHIGPVEQGVVSAMFHVRGNAYTLQHDSGLAVGERAQLAISAAADSGLRIFRQGQLVAELQAPLQVSGIEDVNNWLGRSQWEQDPMLAATLLDFRIYGVALSEAELAALYQESLAVP